VNVSPALRPHRPSFGAVIGRLAAALLAAIALQIVVPRAQAATLSSAAFRPPTLTTQWMLDSGDCASSVSLSNSPTVDAYGFFTGWHVTWGTGNCLATSNARAFGRKAGAYYVLGHRLRAGTYHVQLQYCHDSDFSKRRGNYYCRATNALSVRIPKPKRF
jgi:hypothetical protein